MTLRIDIHEPSEGIRWIGTAVDAKVTSLNTDGFADYKWETAQGELVQVERKQWGEILSGMDKVEDQLRRHRGNHPEGRLVLLLEGTAIQTSLGITVLRSTNRDSVWVTGRNSSIRMGQVYAWLYAISRFVEIYQTSNYGTTCAALVAFYKYDQKTEHTTFSRHFKPITFIPNPQVIQVMGMMPGIGEKRAQALVNKFSTVYNIVTASPQELATVDGIGMKLGTQLLQRIGRFDV